MSEPSLVARHEAAHAWIAKNLGTAVVHLTVVPTKTYQGQCGHVPFDKNDRQAQQNRATVLLAGMAAEHIMAHMPDDLASLETLSHGSFSDFEAAAKATKSEFYQQQNGAYRCNISKRFMAAWEAALWKVRLHWAKIEQLAEFLLRHQRMGECCMLAIRHIEAGKDMAEWRYCAYCGIKLPESEDAA